MSAYVLLVVVVGLIRLVASMRSRSDTRAVVLHRPSPDDPRWGPPRQEEQIVGQPCARCEHPFVLASEAKRCKKCSVWVHKGACFGEHKMAEHKGTAAPYR